ncbi:MAG TPA: hypothetical protein VII01_07005, partial [Solirubrobacteraceae bacterium]
RRTIPAGGSFALQMSFAQDLGLAEAQNHANAAVSSYSPTLTIAEPLSGSVLSYPSATVSGRLSSGDVSALLTVDGAPVPVEPTGAWSTTVTLQPGPNTITVTASGEEGLATSRSITVSYVPHVSPPEVPPVSEAPTEPPGAQPITEVPATPKGPPFAEAEAPTNESSLTTDPFASPPISTPGVGATSAAPPAASATTASLIGPIQVARREVSFFVACVGPEMSVCDIASSVDAIETGPRSRDHAATRRGHSTSVRLGSANYAIRGGHARKIVMSVDPSRVDSPGGSRVPAELVVTMTAVRGQRQTVAVRRLSIVARKLQR